MNPKLRIINLKKSFGEKRVLDGVGLTFNDRGVYVIVGESGRGKTTLLRIISGLCAYCDGKVIGGGINECAYVFQEYRLFPTLTALENVACVLDNDDAINISKAMLRKLKISDADFEKLPNELSGGMKQRVSIARALVTNRPILLLDEPTKELDDELRHSLLNIIKEEGKRRLVLVVTHNQEDAALIADTVIEL